MLANHSIQALSLAVRLACFFKAGPYLWDSQQKRISMDTKKSSKLCFWIVSGFLAGHFTFVFIRSVYAFVFLSGSTTKFLLQLSMVASIALSVSCSLNTICRSRQMAEFTNFLLIVDEELTSKFVF